ncbi:hypothetical protein ASE95_05655 [Sphingomonas sp. Leaf231]|uniref:fimbria/pilus outer membrane usher protein n=1 Tax=Sphingomonas sp. Leaf231 TaxID=1736301 RepID=UPI0006FA11B5|nr:fimbria/pilus outer membrane usher protein [Sphingomonas sp. Leaf231]KQN94318.1 hypothetical protein ASE95_05655 [Sphingomonas sp. Leaf231]
MRIAVLLAALLLGCIPASARADDAASVAVAAPADLIVELVLNGVGKPDLVPLRVDGAHLWIDAAALRTAGLSLDTPGAIDVAALDGFRSRYDPLNQRLLLDAPPEFLPVQHVASRRATRTPTTADTGAMLAYEAFGYHGGRSTSASLWTEQRFFGNFGVISNQGTFRMGGMGGARYVRLDTRFRHVDEDRLVEATVGDLMTNALSWTPSVRLGGVQVARSFRARPDLITTPLPRFAGQAAVPTGVELFVDGYRQSQTQVQPGRFVLDDIPVVNGAGAVTVVTTDAVGRQVATTVPFYVAPELLKPGMTDFSAELGKLRRGYALDNFRYGRAAVSGSLRHGVSDRLTMELHGEGAARLANVGAGALWTPGHVGALRGAVAVSRRDGVIGHQITAGYSYTNRRFAIGAEHNIRSEGYADLGTFDLARWRGRGSNDRVSGSIALERVGSFGAGYVDARSRDGFRVRLASLSWSKALGPRISAFANVNYDVDRAQASGQVRLVMALGRASVHAGVSADRDRGAVMQAGFSRAIPTQGGLGFAADGAVAEDGAGYGQANVGWRGRAMNVELGASAARSAASIYAGVSGALVMLAGETFAAATVPDSFAVVDTGAANVPVRYENQLVGRTGAKGHLFIPGVAAFYAAHYSIDTLDLPVDNTAEQVERHVALRPGTGAMIHLPVRRTRSVMVLLSDANGAPLAPGGEARVANGDASPIGWGGLLVLDRVVASGVELDVVRADGGTCRARVAVPADLPSFGRIGPVACR